MKNVYDPLATKNKQNAKIASMHLGGNSSTYICSEEIICRNNVIVGFWISDIEKLF